ncbi:MAG: EF-hand domain-containing protein [Pseudomonadota bacterium]
MKKWTYGAVALVSVAVVSGAAFAQANRGSVEFSDLDASGDGILTVEDFEARQDARFAEMDANGDGSVDAAEFAAFAAAQASERAAERFDRLDADGDGLLSRDVLEARQSRGRGIERMIERFDTDGDGGLSEAEFDTAREEMRDRRGGKGGRRG